jgi:hypothetical protein
MIIGTLAESAGAPAPHVDAGMAAPSTTGCQPRLIFPGGA